MSRIFCWVRAASPKDRSVRHLGMRIIHVSEMYFSGAGSLLLKNCLIIGRILSENRRKGIRMLNVVLNFADDLCKQ